LFLHRDFDLGVHLAESFPHSPTFRPQRFSRSRRFAPPGLRGFVSPHCHVRDFLFRGFPRQSADADFHPLVPSCRWCRSKTPRLQGFDPIVDPLYLRQVLPWC
jgi:hypothetical protein